MSDNHIALLRRSPDLARAPDDAIERLAANASLRQLEAQQPVWRLGDAVSHVFVPEGGLVQISFVGQQGNLLTSSIIRFGYLFGEAEVFAGMQSRLNEAISLSNCRMLAIPAESFREVVTQCPRMSAYWLRASNVRFMLALKHAYALSLRSADERLAHIVGILLEHADINTAEVSLPFSQEALASLAAMSRPATTQVISTWRQKGWVIPAYQKLIICQPEVFPQLGNWGA